MVSRKNLNKKFALISVFDKKNLRYLCSNLNKHNYNLLQESLKIDDLVDPRMTTVSTIMKHVHTGTIDTVYSLLDGEYEFLEAKILETSELVGKSIKDSNLPEEVRVGAIVRKSKVMMPKSTSVFDHVL